MAGDVNIYLYGCVSLLVPECAGYLSVYVCKTHIKTVLVQRYQALHGSITSLSEITHQMWLDHPFSQKTRHQK